MADPPGRQELLDRLRAEETEAFAGWDFPHLRGRLVEESEPWDYAGIVRHLLPNTTSMLDMGTAGGELLSVLHPLPPDTRATEAYGPNLPIARRRLEPLEIVVVAIEDHTRLPSATATFDLVSTDTSPTTRPRSTVSFGSEAGSSPKKSEVRTIRTSP